MGIFGNLGLPKHQLTKKEEEELRRNNPGKYEKYMTKKPALQQKGMMQGKQKEEKPQTPDYQEIYRASYKRLKEDISCPQIGIKTVTVDGYKYMMWVADDKLTGIPHYPSQFEFARMVDNYGATPKWRTFCLPISSILYFERRGNVTTNSVVSGGGSNIAGAIVGDMIAGAAGAIIASREPIKTELVTIDTRETVIVCNNKIFHSSFNDYDALMSLIPWKEKSAASTNRSQPAQSGTDLSTKLREIKTMLDEGLITQDEYESKKTEILSRI